MRIDPSPVSDIGLRKNFQALTAEGLLKEVLIKVATIDFASANAGLADEATVVVPGAQVGDPVLIGTPAAPDAGAAFFGYVSAVNTVKVRFVNNTAGAVNPASGSYKIMVLRLGSIVGD